MLAYVQCEIDHILANLPSARAYIDDIIFIAKVFPKYLSQIQRVSSQFVNLNIMIKAKKTFLRYLSIILLGHYIDSLGLSMTKEHLAAIAKLIFLETLQELETYLRMTDFLYQYVPYYVSVTLPLQNHKTELLKYTLSKGQEHKTFIAHEAFVYSTGAERAFFAKLQKSLIQKTILYHYDLQ